MNIKVNIVLFSALFGFLFQPTLFASNKDVIPDQYIIMYKDQNMKGRAKHRIKQTGELMSQTTRRLMREVRQHQRLMNNRKGIKNHSKQANRMIAEYKEAIKGFAAKLTPEAVDFLKNKNEIDYIEEDLIVTADVVQTNPLNNGLDRIDQRNLPLDGSYEHFTDGTGVHLFVIDSGIRASHREFSGRVANGRNFVNDGRNQNQDCSGHGTHVTGIAAGTNFGVAKNVTIHPVRVFGCTDSSPYSIIMAAMDWVTGQISGTPIRGSFEQFLPAVVNMSLSGPSFRPVDRAAQRLTEVGATLVVSAGNDNTDACRRSPARAGVAITVAASDIRDRRAGFSNFGSCVDIFAPGVSIRSADYRGNTRSRLLSGTSMSSPHVAGAVALYLQENRNASPAEVTTALINSSTTNRVNNAGSRTPNRLLYSTITSPVAHTLPGLDPSLRRCLELRHNGVRVKDLTQLSCSSIVQGIQGIEQLSRLERINLNDNIRLTDISPLARLSSSIRSVSMRDNAPSCESAEQVFEEFNRRNPRAAISIEQCQLPNGSFIEFDIAITVAHTLPSLDPSLRRCLDLRHNGVRVKDLTRLSCSSIVTGVQGIQRLLGLESINLSNNFNLRDISRLLTLNPRTASGGRTIVNLENSDNVLCTQLSQLERARFNVIRSDFCRRASGGFRLDD